MIIGRLGQEPDVRYTQSDTAVANLSIATSEKYKDNQGEMREDTEWHRVVAWGRTAEICQEYLQKGSQVYIEGPIQTKEWEDNDGQTRYSTEIKAMTLTMLGNKGESGDRGKSPNQPPHPGADEHIDSNVDLDEDFDDLDDDLPF